MPFPQSPEPAESGPRASRSPSLSPHASAAPDSAEQPNPICPRSQSPPNHRIELGKLKPIHLRVAPQACPHPICSLPKPSMMAHAARRNPSPTSQRSSSLRCPSRTEPGENASKLKSAETANHAHAHVPVSPQGLHRRGWPICPRTSVLASSAWAGTWYSYYVP
jgi:hypothetical protein